MNRFSGNISVSLISSLLSLEYIDLSRNRFQGSFPFSIFANHSRLAIVDFGKNSELEVETEYPNWSAKFQLEVLMLSNCILNKPIGEVPKFLLHQHKLKVVDLSHNNLKGNFPYRLLENMTMLQVLSLRNNSLYGQINLPESSRTSIFWMDLSSNNFDGQLQQNLGNIFPNVTYLNLSRNAFEGTITASLCAMNSLNRLDLSFNNFSGEVPKQLVGGCVNLDILKLSGNNFHGQILSSHFNLTELTILHLNDNEFSGAISNALSKSTRLVKFDVSDNYMSGEIPKCTSNMTNLESVIMRNNFFRGKIPDLRSTTFLDLSNNMLSGALPSWPDLHFLEHMHLQGNKFSGSLPENFSNVSFLLTLDIRDNNFSGNIPITIDAASNMRVLLLAGNRLSGLVPNQLCKLEKISLLDLSNNLLSGSIPRCFKDIAFGKIGASDPAFLRTEILTWYTPAIGNYGYLLPRMFILQEHLQDMDSTYNEQDEIEFITKSRHSSYKGDILNFMSGLDLSCNNLTGEIPFELGELAWVHALNFSHNHLVGSIPKSLSKLKQIESLDLSHNSLTGEIPSELTDLNFLGVFSVAYNNLSGRIPNAKAQFGTFENSSYEGNPFLCGPPLINCSSEDEPPPSAITKPEKTDSRWYDIDLLVFFASFSASYVIFLIGVVTLLHINPHWQQRLFYYCEEFLFSWYYCYSNIQRKFRCCF